MYAKLRTSLEATLWQHSHILDPKTGWPIPVAADTCTRAGMLSTLAMLKGAQAEVFLDAQEQRYWCNRG